MKEMDEGDLEGLRAIRKRREELGLAPGKVTKEDYLSALPLSFIIGKLPSPEQEAIAKDLGLPPTIFTDLDSVIFGAAGTVEKLAYAYTGKALPLPDVLDPLVESNYAFWMGVAAYTVAANAFRFARARVADKPTVTLSPVWIVPVAAIGVGKFAYDAVYPHLAPESQARMGEARNKAIDGFYWTEKRIKKVEEFAKRNAVRACSGTAELIGEVSLDARIAIELMMPGRVKDLGITVVESMRNAYMDLTMTPEEKLMNRRYN